MDGMENIDQNKVQIFASNHSSFFDVFVLNSIIPVKFGWISKKEIFNIPFIGWHMKAQGYVSIDRSDGRKALQSIKEAASKIRNGSRIVIFPEGTRTREKGVLQPFKKGLFHLCIRTRVPIVPMYITGTFDILKPDSLLIRPFQKVYVKIGKELPTVDYPKNKTNILMNDLRDRMVQLEKGMNNRIKRAG